MLLPDGSSGLDRPQLGFPCPAHSPRSHFSPTCGISSPPWQDGGCWSFVPLGWTDLLQLPPSSSGELLILRRAETSLGGKGWLCSDGDTPGSPDAALAQPAALGDGAGGARRSYPLSLSCLCFLTLLLPLTAEQSLQLMAVPVAGFCAAEGAGSAGAEGAAFLWLTSTFPEAPLDATLPL